MSNTVYEVRHAIGPGEVKGFDTAALRKNFLIDNLMQPDKVVMVYSHYDRVITGSVVPQNIPLQLEAIPPLKSQYFLERREIGIFNIGGSGSILIDGKIYEIDFKEAIYIGMGSKEIVFNSTNTTSPAKFYFISAPAHYTYPLRKITKSDAEIAKMGSLQNSNARTINKMLVNSVVPTCQLQMGMTELETGSVWNTFPPHVHDRRMEVYFYFEVPQNQIVCHFMGEPQETRHIFMQNMQAVISPDWSIHSAAASSNYTFIWGMAGENMDYGDMDVCKPTDLM